MTTSKDEWYNFSFFCDLNQVERDEGTQPTKLMRALLSLGSLYELEIDLGQQEIHDGEVFDHPVLSCKLKTKHNIVELRKHFSDDFYVIDPLDSPIAIANTKQQTDPLDPRTISHFLLGELSLINFQQQRITDWSNLQAKANVEYLDLISKQLQRFLKRDKMIPFQIVFELIEEKIDVLQGRDNKRFRIWTQGGDVLVENTIIEELVPEVHALTEFIVNHSIEPEDKRRELAKPAESQISFRVAQYEDQVELIVSDDGSGTDEKALAEIISQIKPRLESLNSKIAIQTSPDSGVSFKLLLHETIAQIPCETFTWQNQTFAIPLNQVDSKRTILEADCSDNIIAVGHHFYLKQGERNVPAVFLDDVLNHNSRFTEETYKDIYKTKFPLKGKDYRAFEFNLGFKHFALLVEVKTNEALVTISQRPCPPLLVFSGKGVTPDGKPTFILDVFSIGEHSIDLLIDQNRSQNRKVA
ncbi:hypothetical protein [Pseudobacteriovorax antillogorgiicola]|uniref:Uncharacterized protein n=1 Tax=Pseudobacteriovorax antillogorgiicola TaxID=1513793 RepID=A0A1Y6BF26_9BACT|nr:hypothetical protein [Pseudobacteriovorax antillogorgiicola]TCS56342.1 hypothetical protein EDD56_104164 [Pseudobacteriovorax antillogorgiicola]SMF06834.1 hypothetical protein SAMN06296036_104169 [Pseudobacteriovorax antillogorgiicola]